MNNVCKLIVLAGMLIAQAVHAQDRLSLMGGAYLGAKRSSESAPTGLSFGAEYSKRVHENVEASAILGHVSLKRPGFDADHITSLMVGPSARITVLNVLQPWFGLAVGAQLNVMEDWAYMDGTNRISFYDSKSKIALAYAGRVGVDYKIGESTLVGLQGEYVGSSYTLSGTSTDASNVVTPISRSVTQSWFSVMAKVGFEF